MRGTGGQPAGSRLYGNRVADRATDAVSSGIALFTSIMADNLAHI